MANTGLVFPIDISKNSKGGPRYSTSITVARSGLEKRNSNWIRPLHVYDVSYGIKTKEHVKKLVNFFHQHMGMGHSFRYYDYLDHSADYEEDGLGTSQGTAQDMDGEGTTWQLYKTYSIGSSNLERKITRPFEDIAVFVEGVPFPPDEIDIKTGIITFPIEVRVVTWSGNFYVPCRFDTDTLELEIAEQQQSGNLICSTSVPLVEDRE
jgi:uncharacterized protein (TIGR02217 family)